MNKPELDNLIRGWPIPAHDMFRLCLELEPHRIAFVLGAKEEYALAMASAMSVLGRGKVNVLPNIGSGGVHMTPLLMKAAELGVGDYMVAATDGEGINSTETTCIPGNCKDAFGNKLFRGFVFSLLPRISHGGIIWLTDFEPSECVDGIKLLESCCGLPPARDNREHKFRMYVKL